MRRLLRLVQVIGVLALVGLLYAWRHPDTLARWSERRDAAGVTAPQPQPMPAGNDAAGSTPLAAAVPAPRSVTGAQAAVAQWIGARYGVAPGAIAPLVAEADILGRKYGFTANLLMAVMAIESNFHPYIESQAGAQGLMQVMPQVHSRRYEKFGGKTAFVDPIVSLRVGAEILRDCVRLRGGSEAEGLRFYFGGGPSSATYIEKVRAEQGRLNAVARGGHVPTTG
jgi:soluble lytic murein transglycosylase-like protein